VLVAKSIALKAQNTKQITNQNLYWIAYFNTIDFGNRWFVTSEIQERRFLQPHKQHQLLFRSHLHFRFGKGWDASAGFAYFLQSPHDPNSSLNLVIPELRPYIEFNYKPGGDRVAVHHRYRAEWRFFHNTSNDELTDGYWNYFRFRYKLGIDIVLLKDNGKQRSGLKLKLSNEIHFNAGSNIVRNAFDQNRLYAGFQYQVHKSLAVELGYMRWIQQRSSGYQYYDRDIIRLAIHHKIKLTYKN
jgi:hypothetical protein